MNRLTYTIQDDGYLTLWPPQRLGNDFNRALRKVRGTIAPRAATGYALARVGKSEHLPPSISLQDARTYALQWTNLEPVTICEAVAIGLNDTVLFRRVEKLQSCNRFDEMPDDAELVIPGGEIMMKKAADPKMPRGFDQLADKLTRGLAYEDRKWFKPYLRKYMNVIAVDWKRMSKNRHREIWNKAERVIKKADVRRLTDPWTQRITLDMKVVAKGTKRHLRNHYMPRISTALTQPDTKAIGQIGKQQGWFLRDQMGKRSEALTKHGERVVKQGLKDGWGREQIAKELEKTVGGMWQKYGRNYSMAVASVALSRARSWSEVKSYQDIGIEQLEIQAILDEATTDYCRMIDGQVISVNECSSLMEQGANVQNPEDIKTVNPFMTTRRDPETGQRSIFTATGTRLADITRSGHGARDDRGEYRAHVFGNKLPSAANIGMPPYHHLCYDKETEVLTEDDGFKKFSELTGEERVMTVSLPRLNPEYQNIKSLISYQHTGKMLHFKTHSFDLMVTPDHKMVVARRWHYRMTGERKYELIQASDVPAEGFIPRRFNYEGKPIRKLRFGDFVIDGDLFASFMGWYLSEGSVRLHKNKKTAEVKIAQYKSRGQDLLLRDLFALSPRVSEQGHFFKVSYEFGKYLKNFGHSHEKYVPKNLMNASRYQIALFLETYCKGDGTHYAGKKWKGYKFRDYRSYSTASKRMASHLGELMMKLGKTPSFYIDAEKGKKIVIRGKTYYSNHDVHGITENSGKDFEGQPSIRKKMKEVAYDDMVYCVEVEKHNTLVVRRNGKVTICGNCRTYTLPKTTLVQIPRGFQAQALPIPPRPVPLKPRRVKPKPTGLVSPRKVQPRPALITGDRPVSIVKTPQRGKPTDVGYAIPQPEDPYEREGLIENISLEKQVLERSKRAMKKLSDSIAKQQKKVGRPLTRNEIGDNLTKEIRKEVGPSQSIAGLVPPKVQHKRAYKSKRKLNELYTEATRFTGERLMKELKRKGMASIVPTTGNAYYQHRLQKIAINPKNMEHLRHEYGHHLSTLGKNLEAEVIFRKRHTTGTFMVKIPGGGTGKVGNWGDQYCARIYRHGKGTEVFSQVHGVITTDKRLHESLANLWEANPEHIGFALSILQGSFI